MPLFLNLLKDHLDMSFFLYIYRIQGTEHREAHFIIFSVLFTFHISISVLLLLIGLIIVWDLFMSSMHGGIINHAWLFPFKGILKFGQPYLIAVELMGGGMVWLAQVSLNIFCFPLDVPTNCPGVNSVDVLNQAIMPDQYYFCHRSLKQKRQILQIPNYLTEDTCILLLIT